VRGDDRHTRVAMRCSLVVVECAGKASGSKTRRFVVARFPCAPSLARQSTRHSLRARSARRRRAALPTASHDGAPSWPTSTRQAQRGVRVHLWPSVDDPSPGGGERILWPARPECAVSPAREPVLPAVQLLPAGDRQTHLPPLWHCSPACPLLPAPSDLLPVPRIPAPSLPLVPLPAPPAPPTSSPHTRASLRPCPRTLRPQCTPHIRRHPATARRSPGCCTRDPHQVRSHPCPGLSGPGISHRPSPAEWHTIPSR
jgi:hypothetical protein